MKKHRTQIHCIEAVLVPAGRRPQPILIRVPESLELNKSSMIYFQKEAHVGSFYVGSVKNLS